MEGKVYIIILNWNGWKDTIECLESVFRNRYSNYQVIVCDNNSSDDSLNKIKEWADGKVNAPISPQQEIAKYTYPAIQKPISYAEYNFTNDSFEEIEMENGQTLILIQNMKNLGFAGGNNIGIRYALKKQDFSYIWLLNNDTVIADDALEELVLCMERNSDIGICGSVLRYYYHPQDIQGIGGCYYKFLGVSRHIKKVNELNKMDYVIGASMMISCEVIKKVGLLSEDYFLYFEELDLATRCKKYFKLACALNSVVYHKEGASIGTGEEGKQRSELADYYIIRNRIVFTKKFFPYYLFFVYIALLGAIINRIRRKQYKRMKMIIKIAWDLK